MIGYKATFSYKCKNILFEIGKTYEINKPLELGSSGFHFCTNPENVLDYYEWTPNFKLLKIKALGDILTDNHKYCSNKILILSEINDDNELLKLTGSLFKYNSINQLVYKCYNGNVTEYYYNDLGRLSKEVYNQKSWKSYSYLNGKVHYIENSSGYWELFERNENGEIDYYEDSNGFYTCRKYYNNQNITIISSNSHEIDIKK